MSLGMTYSPWGEGAMWEDLSLDEYVMGEEKFSEKGAGFSSTTKKTMKKQTWKSFFNWK